VLRLLEGEQLVPALRRRAAGGGPTAGASVEPAPRAAGPQLGLFAGEEHAVVRRLRGLDINALTPLEALTLLNELSREVRGPS
jgi:hypothetical protein